MAAETRTPFSRIRTVFLTRAAGTRTLRSSSRSNCAATCPSGMPDTDTSILLPRLSTPVDPLGSSPKHSQLHESVS
jgi:hypothetical protein